MQFLYISILLFSLTGLAFYDWREKVALFGDSDRRRALIICLVMGVSFFLLWDIAGVVAGIFATNPQYTAGFNLFTPNLPIEEILFLTLICYTTLLLAERLER